jgi:cyclophilin family peptidyl-prolyl cis-trans isomerase
MSPTAANLFQDYSRRGRGSVHLPSTAKRRMQIKGAVLVLGILLLPEWLPLRVGADGTCHAQQVELQRGLVGHWKLAGDTKDHSGNGNHAKNHGVDLKASDPDGGPGGAGLFNGRDRFLEVPASSSLRLGKGDFSVAAWVYTNRDLDDVPGDIISQYDPVRRRGFHLTLKSNAGVTFNHANDRHLQFGIDDNRETAWVDCGRPGKAILAFALAARESSLYAGTCEPEKDQSGRVYRYDGGQRWIDCGSPASCNAVTAMAVFDGQLFVGTGKYRLGGSALQESENPQLGGKVFRYDGNKRWIECGQLPKVEAVGGMVVYGGRLYASSLYKPAGFFRYEADGKWTDCGTPDGKRVEALGIYNGHIYATSYDGGRVYRYDGRSWTYCGQLGDPKENTQTYSIAVHHGRLYVGTWRSGRVYRFEDVDRWTDVGRLGQELEVMGMLVHNGRLLAGTLPLAEVYAYEGESKWKRLAQLDRTPDVKYRRAWTMVEYQGRVFCSTLPSGHVYAFAAGSSVTWDRSFPAGWHHVAAVRSHSELKLFVDGKLVSTASVSTTDYDLASHAPLRIGFGANDYFNGRLSDVRLYRRALSTAEIGILGQHEKPIRVVIQTDQGALEVELDAARAPNTVANFLRYVDAKFYDGGRFHRTVMPDNQPDNKVKIEVIQAGINPAKAKEEFPSIKLERTRDTKLAHKDGTISMARDGPDTATSDFFICIGDQPELDFGGTRNPDGQGFAAFGRVVSGMDIVRKIQQASADGQTLTPPIRILTVRRTR